MALPLWIDNLIAYSLQIAILASAGTLLAYLFRLRMPRVLLAYWQILLLVCLVLPALQTWKHPVQFRTSAMVEPVVFDIPAAAAVPVDPKPSFSITPEMIGMVLGVGICLRLMWLALGFLRLHLFVRKSQPLSVVTPASGGLLSRIGGQVHFYLSHEIDSPATFGFISPTVILPGSFSGMSEACRDAVVCHELLHVHRRDWIVIFIEEIVRSLYWFHPAVWWLLGRIHLSREQSVDCEVVRLTGSRQPYLDSLLEIARSRGRPKAVPAPLFLRERHLVQRVALLLKEVSMNRMRLAVSLAGIALFLAGTVHLAAGWFPLTGDPKIVEQKAATPEVATPGRRPVQIESEAPGGQIAANAFTVPPAHEPAGTAGTASQESPAADDQAAVPGRQPLMLDSSMLGSRLIRKVAPVYPELAKKARVSGAVVLRITVNEEGIVTDVQAISGHPLLKDAAITAVKQWRYSPTLLNGVAVPVIATVTVEFRLDGSPSLLPSELEQRGTIFGISDSGSGAGAGVLQRDGLGGIVLYRAILVDAKNSIAPKTEAYHAPELATSQDLFQQWRQIAESGWPAGIAKSTAITYMFMINEVGEIKNFMRVQGPEIPELEKAVTQVGVVAPGLQGSNPVRSLCTITINLAPAGMASNPTGAAVMGGTVTDASGAPLSGREKRERGDAYEPYAPPCCRKAEILHRATGLIAPMGQIPGERRPRNRREIPPDLIRDRLSPATHLA